LAAVTSLGALVGVLAWVVASVDPRSTFGVQTESLTGAPAAFGFALEANILGGMCAIWLVLDVLYVQRPRLVASGLVRGLLGLGLLVSLTRAAALGAVVGIVVGTLASRRRRRIGATVLLTGGLTVGGLFLVGPTVPMLRPVVEKGTQLLDLGSSTNVVRRQSWDLALDDLSLGNVVIGNGVNSFGQRHTDPSRPSERVPGYLGNLFLQVVYDVGLIGTLLVGAAAISILKRRSSRDRRVLGVIACGAIVGAATSPLWFANWWVIVALAALAGRRTVSARTLLASRAPPAQVAGSASILRGAGARGPS
jgi:O-antigen ligase